MSTTTINKPVLEQEYKIETKQKEHMGTYTIRKNSFKFTCGNCGTEHYNNYETIKKFVNKQPLHKGYIQNYLNAPIEKNKDYKKEVE